MPFVTNMFNAESSFLGDPHHCISSDLLRLVWAMCHPLVPAQSVQVSSVYIHPYKSNISLVDPHFTGGCYVVVFPDDVS